MAEGDWSRLARFLLPTHCLLDKVKGVGSGPGRLPVTGCYVLLRCEERRKEMAGCWQICLRPRQVVQGPGGPAR